uniref:EF-hand domain-containing protein n=1 Tax=Haemonchus contortus TaxID=6289 RepID=A0A7I4Y2Q2_HAECO
MLAAKPSSPPKAVNESAPSAGTGPDQDVLGPQAGGGSADRDGNPEQNLEALLEHMSEEIFGVKPDKLTDSVLDRPENPVAERTEKEVSPDDDAHDFLLAVLDFLSDVNQGKISREEALKGIDRTLRRLPGHSKAMLMDLFPSLRLSQSTAVSADDSFKIVLDRICEEMFGEEVEKLKCEILDESENPVAQMTLTETSSDDFATDFVYVTFDSMNKVKRGEITRDVAVRRIREYFEGLPSPSEGMLLKKYPSLERITGRAKASAEGGTAPIVKRSIPSDQELSLQRLSEEMFGESQEKIRLTSLDAPRNPTAERTVRETRSDSNADVFVRGVMDTLKMMNEESFTKEAASKRIARFFKYLPAHTKLTLVTLFPSVRPLYSAAKGAENNSKTSLDRISEELFGRRVDKLNDQVTRENHEELVARAQKDAGQDTYATLFVHTLFDTLCKVNKGEFTQDAAFERIREHFQEMPPQTQRMFSEKFSSLEPFRCEEGNSKKP